VSQVRLVSLVDVAGGTGTGPDTRPAVLSLAEVGFKAARLSRALHAGLPVLPGWVVPISASREALEAGAAALRASGLAAGRVAVLGVAVDPELEEELRCVVGELGGRVIVRSSSPLEGDAVWAGAFSSVAGVGCDDVAGAVRSCWASAFAPDPLGRLDACELDLEALELAVLVQPEIAPVAGGVARVTAGCGVSVAGVRGHPGPLLSGWAEGARDADLAGLIGSQTVADVAGLARRVHAALGDDVIEWGACGGKVWLLQSLRGASRPAAAPATQLPEDGIRVRAQPAAPGTATGPLLPCRPHQAVDCRGAILLVDRPLPALAPLLFGASGVISRAAAAGSHLAEVARSLGVPMVTGCRTETATGPDPALGAWHAVIDGATGEVLLSPAMGRRPPRPGAPGGGLTARR